ncbi:MAG: tRNA lysidine(34) synthetase TilS [Candidatus Moranbacteria bacterium]|nr:tRNA lysidine(34) synthetase TilS [Candidatus Moranbacteria bacterium]
MNKLFPTSKTSSVHEQPSLPFEARRILKRVLNLSPDARLIREKASILIAVSGGPDSVCLLDILAFLRERYDTSLAIAHINYQLRGEESDRDEFFVRELAKYYQVPCFVRHYPKNSRKNDEESLRTFRYTFFAALSKRHHFDTVALGHQQNDQAETLLLNLLRGSGPLGLAGMSPKHGNYIRPLLDTPREDVLRYLAVRGLAFKSDASNTDTRYARNRIRHELVPLLQKRFNPNIIATLARSATLFGDLAQKHAENHDSCPVTYRENTAHFSRVHFHTLQAGSQKTLLREIARTLSGTRYTPTQAVLNEFGKMITTTKKPSASMTSGPLKCVRNHDTVFLSYSLS